MKAFFRALASAFPKEAPAQAVAGVLLLALSLYGLSDSSTFDDWGIPVD